MCMKEVWACRREPNNLQGISQLSLNPKVRIQERLHFGTNSQGTNFSAVPTTLNYSVTSVVTSHYQSTKSATLAACTQRLELKRATTPASQLTIALSPLLSLMF